MSTTEGQNLALGGQDRAGDGAGQDPRLLGVRASPSEREGEGEEGAAFLPPEELSRDLPEEEDGQAATWAAEESWVVKLPEEKDEREEEDDGEVDGEDDGEEEEFEFGDEDEPSQDFEFEFGNQEGSEYESEEQDENQEDNEEEETEEEEDSNGQEGPRVLPAGPPEAPMARFRSVFGPRVRLLPHRIHDNDHVLVRPHEGRVAVSRHSREPQDPGEGPAPQDQENPREEAEVRVGESLAEGTSPLGPQEPEERAASQKAGEPAAEAPVKENKALGDASESREAGACAPAKVQVGEWLSSPQALAAPVGAPGSKAGGAQHLPLAVKQRVKALKNLQAQHAQVEARFYKDLHDLEKKYGAFYQTLFDKRSEIVNAIHEPTEGECQWQRGVPEGVAGGNGKRARRSRTSKWHTSLLVDSF